MLERIARFLRENNFDDFADADDFAKRAFEQLAESLKQHWSNKRAVKSIDRTVRSTYDFYRLKDVTPFGKRSPVKLRFGGADTRSVEFFGKLDHFYFSKFADNRGNELKKFLREAYLENGSAIFGKRTSDELADFRKAAGDKFKNITDRSVETIIHTSVQRIRIWGHVGSMAQAKIKSAEYRAILDSRTTEICRGINGKKISITSAQKTIERLNKLEPGEFAKELYENDAAKAFHKDPVKWLESGIDDNDFVNESDVASGFAIPPLHPNCRTRLVSIIAGTK